MLGFLILYFIGKPFYDLAILYGKNKWSYAIGGIVIYYLSITIFSLILGIVCGILDSNFLEETNDSVLNLIGVPIGLLACTALYYILKKDFSKHKTVDENLTDMLNEIGTENDL